MPLHWAMIGDHMVLPARSIRNGDSLLLGLNGIRMKILPAAPRRALESTAEDELAPAQVWVLVQRRDLTDAAVLIDDLGDELLRRIRIVRRFLIRCLVSGNEIDGEEHASQDDNRQVLLGRFFVQLHFETFNPSRAPRLIPVMGRNEGDVALFDEREQIFHSLRNPSNSSGIS